MEFFDIVNERKNSFFSQLKLSESASRNYRHALTSSFLKEILTANYNINTIFEVTDIKELWDIYTQVNIHPKNIAQHRAYSAAIMKYIRFLNNGNKYGKRIDYLKRKGPRKKD